MIPLPRRSLFAIAAVVDVALHGRPAPVAANALAARHGLRPRHLESALQSLVRAGILKGIRGPRGGYELARERRRVSVGDIIRAAARGAGEGEGGASGPDFLSRVIAPALAGAGEAYLAALDGITVEALCRAAGRAEDEGETNFTI